MSLTNKPVIFVTMGDPAGIGPEIVMKSMASPEIKGLAVFIIVADAPLIKEVSRNTYTGKLSALSFDDIKKGIHLDDSGVYILDPGSRLSGVIPGKATPDGARKALECLRSAVDAMRTSFPDRPKALVTAPLSKENISRISPGFIGHTEYLKEMYSKDHVTMVFIGKSFCVIPVTRHIPLKDVAGQLTGELITKTLLQVAENRRIITGKDDVIIGVSALNPHSGEGGRMGLEESDIIVPAIEKARRYYKRIIGPISADVIFYKAIKKELDIVVSMYHDQALAPFKMVDFDSGVNMTIGLDHIRVSPDHGTAFDIAGKGIASSKSMEEAIKLAVRAITI